MINFLKANGISDAEISIAAPGIVDMQAERYGNQSAPYRYNVTSVITVSSNQVEKVRELIVKQASLLEKGVAIVSGDYQYNTQFLFTKLNELKPEMIAEATQNARVAANIMCIWQRDLTLCITTMDRRRMRFRCSNRIT